MYRNVLCTTFYTLDDSIFQNILITWFLQRTCKIQGPKVLRRVAMDVPGLVSKHSCCLCHCVKRLGQKQSHGRMKQTEPQSCKSVEQALQSKQPAIMYFAHSVCCLSLPMAVVAAAVASCCGSRSPGSSCLGLGFHLRLGCRLTGRSKMTTQQMSAWKVKGKKTDNSERKMMDDNNNNNNKQANWWEFVLTQQKKICPQCTKILATSLPAASETR